MSSLFRKETYKELKYHRLDGEVLDVGGSKNADYHKLFAGDYTYTSVNIGNKCDVVIDVEKNQLPFDDSKYDAVLMINLLEHVYDYNFVLSEARRVLRNGGVLMCVVPFFINVHPSPNDYFRFTRQALDRIFRENKFTKTEIKEIGSGFFAVHYYLWQRFLPGFVDVVMASVVNLSDKLLSYFAKTFHARYNRNEYPLGYFIKTIK